MVSRNSLSGGGRLPPGAVIAGRVLDVGFENLMHKFKLYDKNFENGYRPLNKKNPGPELKMYGSSPKELI
jgi:hypothetical protein